MKYFDNEIIFIIPLWLQQLNTMSRNDHYSRRSS